MKQHDKLIKLIANKVAEHPKLSKSFNFSNVHQKYFLTDYLIDILYVLKTGIAWRDLRSHINWISVYKTYCKLVSFKIIEACYQDLLDKYLSKSLPSKMGHILTVPIHLLFLTNMDMMLSDLTISTIEKEALKYH